MQRLQAEIDKIKADISARCIDIATLYKRMSKVSDYYRWEGIQEGINQQAVILSNLRIQFERARSSYFEAWEKVKADNDKNEDYQGWR